MGSKKKKEEKRIGVIQEYQNSCNVKTAHIEVLYHLPDFQAKIFGLVLLISNKRLWRRWWGFLLYFSYFLAMYGRK
jgi:hypothetical protein